MHIPSWDWLSHGFFKRVFLKCVAFVNLVTLEVLS